MGKQIFNRLSINLYHHRVYVFPLDEILGEHTHTRADFENIPRGLGVIVQRIHYCSGYTLVSQEMLAERLLCSYFHIAINLYPSWYSELPHPQTGEAGEAGQWTCTYSRPC